MDNKQPIGRRTTVAVTPDFRELYEKLKAKNYNFSQVSYQAIEEAMKAGMALPARSEPKGYLKASEKEYVGALVPSALAEELDVMTKPTGSKQAYIRAAIQRWADKNLKP